VSTPTKSESNLLSKEQFRWTTLLEIAMAVGSENDLGALLEKSLPLLLRKLNCTLAGVVRIDEHGWETSMVLPKIMARTTQWERLASHFADHFHADSSTCVGTFFERGLFYGFCLKGYGVLILGRTMQLDSVFLREFQPVVEMFGFACRAGLDALRRLEIEKKLAFQAQLEALMADISTRFINLGVEDVAKVVQSSLGEIGRLLDVDRVYVFQCNPDRQLWSNTYEWCAEGIAPQIDGLQDLPMDLLPWWLETHSRLENIVIPDIAAMPPEAAKEQNFLESQGIRSLLAVPMIWNSTLEGFIGFDSVRRGREWQDNDAVRLELLASILISAFKRKDAEQHLLQSQMLLQELNVSLEEKVEERTRQLGETQRQLILGEKMAAIGQLAAGIAHELNNPVGFVAMNFQALEEYLPVIIKVLDGYKQAVQAPPGSVEQHALLEQVIRLEQDASLDFMLQDISKLMEQSQEGVRRMTTIINSMRDFSRSDQHEEFVSTDLNKGLRDTLMICRNIYKHHAEVVSELGDIPNVECIPGQINQVFLNIIVNAAQALAEADLLEKGTIRITTRSASPNVICEIFNNGPGIPEVIRGRIFEAFFTTKPPGKGTGLGLSISHDIVVRTHKGSLTVESDTHHGTTFRISLPIKQARDNSQREG
jgi:signal transduction histidine kinase